ncbi:hypothetical protein C0J52_04444 [Blattella germanica]|nr:hypothetical protein C0J52_04444 [Blattella germanica]
MYFFQAICSQNGPKLDREKNNGGIISRASEPCQRAYPTVTSNTCRIRDIVYDEFLYSHVVGCYCLYYNNPVVFKPNINVRYGSCSIDIPIVKIANGIFVSSDATHKWAHCVEAGVQCCSNMDEDDVNTGSDYCPAVWDGWSCAPKSPAGSIYHPACSDYVYVEDTPTCQQYGDKECFASGSWNTTSDYSSCSGNPLRTMKSRYLYHIITLSVSIGICFPALFIFFLYS